MSISLIFLVLGAAFLHATWNIIVKGGTNKIFETALNALGGGLGAALFLPFLPAPAPDCWHLLALSCVFHLTYYFGVAATYRTTDLSIGYAIMRGTAPMLTALAISLFGTPLKLMAWLGILLLCSGILSLAFPANQQNRDSRKGLLLALATAFMIMGYTLADGFGARLSGNSVSYACWLFVINIFPIHFYILIRHGRQYAAYLKTRAAIGIGGGFCGLASYGIAIWAMTRAPIALVAALRETSVIFGMILAVIVLGEKLTARRVFAILLVVAGAMAARLG